MTEMTDKDFYGAMRLTAVLLVGAILTPIMDGAVIFHTLAILGTLGIIKASGCEL